MDEQMLEQIQQMITTANETLRQNLRQDMAALESRLGERIEETKRHSGVLVEGLRHELQLVAEGIQMHIERRHREDREMWTSGFRNTESSCRRLTVSSTIVSTDTNKAATPDLNLLIE